MPEDLYELQDVHSFVYDGNSLVPTPHKAGSIIARGGRWLDPAEQLPAATQDIVITLPDALATQVSACSDTEKENIAKFLAQLSTK